MHQDAAVITATRNTYTTTTYSDIFQLLNNYLGTSKRANDINTSKLRAGKASQTEIKHHIKLITFLLATVAYIVGRDTVLAKSLFLLHLLATAAANRVTYSARRRRRRERSGRRLVR